MMWKMLAEAIHNINNMTRKVAIIIIQNNIIIIKLLLNSSRGDW